MLLAGPESTGRSGAHESCGTPAKHLASAFFLTPIHTIFLRKSGHFAVKRPGTVYSVAV